MFSKLLFIAALVAAAQAGVFELPGHHTIHAAPAHYAASLIKTGHVAPVTTYHAAPAYHASAAYHAPIIAPHAAPVYKAIRHAEPAYVDAHPHYAFQYGVHDAHTGDVKDQHEERDGDVVKGVYSLMQPDGVTRTVHYTSDHHNGFQAHVEYSGHAAHPQLVRKAVVAKAVVPATTAYYHH